MVSYPIYNLKLAGWRRQSVWGWDATRQSYYAQLTPDTSSREAESQGPEIWISPPRYSVIPDPAALAEAIAQATGVPLAVARQAMNDSLAEGDPLRQPVSLQTFTLIAAPLGEVAPGRPADWDRLPRDARAWAEQQADNDNEMLTVLDGDHRAEFSDAYEVYLAEMG